MAIHSTMKPSKPKQFHLYEFDTSQLNQEKLKAYCSAVTKVQTLIPECWLMGGAIRDLIYGHEPKDLDFFANILRLNRNYSYTFDRAIPELLNVEVHSVRMNGPFAEYDTQSVVYQDQDKTFYEFVSKNSPPAKVLSTFDFSFNQAVCDGQSILVSEEFLETYKTKKVNLLNIRDNSRSKLRVEKFKTKFPDLDFTQPTDLLKSKSSPMSVFAKGATYTYVTTDYFVNLNSNPVNYTITTQT